MNLTFTEKIKVKVIYLTLFSRCFTEQIANPVKFLLLFIDETVLAFLPFFHIYGLTIVLLHGLCDGVKLITFPKFTSQHFINGLRQYRPTFIPSVPPIGETCVHL